ncbi:MAG: M3 family metallopeptidase [Bacteroidaceae bacterium]|nr:M3 family metallopeptidase [Bacteroidaceae bacterium]
MKRLFLPAIICLMMTACQQQSSNPFLSAYNTPFEVPPFEQIKNEHYMPAFEEGIKQQKAEIEAIVNNPESPTFENTILALDLSGMLLRNVELTFFSFTEAMSNDTLRDIAAEVTPMLTAHGDDIMLNEALFDRIKAVYDNRANENLDRAQERLLEKYYNSFVRSGALLSAEDKDALRNINSELSSLSLSFGNNVLAENNGFELLITDEADLAGLPAGSIAAAKEEAATQGKEGWLFNLSAPSRIPFLQYADNRDLREKLYTAYVMRGDNDNENDNKANIKRILELRLQKAQILGYKTYADFVLDDRMAKTDKAVNDLLLNIWKYAVPRAKEEIADMQKIIDREGGNFKLAPWDYAYYAEKVRQEKYALNEDELKPYFSLEKVLNGVFMVAEKLYGITFQERNDIPLYHPEVRTYEVFDAEGKHLAVFFCDYFPRASKRSGAWMSNFRESYVDANGNEVRPLVYNVGNFTKPTAETPSLLTLDEVETLFHEFGHGLHGMLTRVDYYGISGTSVARDFVELPSQITEHWATHPEVLKMYAHHYETGEVIPDELIAKMERASSFNQGFATTELVAAALLDMRMHELDNYEGFDAREFEKKVAAELGLPAEITYRYRSMHFNHVFSGGYEVGYYSYLWAEVLDADAFEAFVENGIFDKATADAFRTNILEAGSSEDPMKLYIQFRGAEPNPEALIRGRGLK